MDANTPPEPNPFEAPQAASTTPNRPGGSTAKRVVLIILAILLTPIAAGIGGFCCCLGGLAVEDMLRMSSGTLAFAGFGLGVLLGGAAVIYGTVRLLRGTAG
jgi:hypothetical protein